MNKLSINFLKEQESKLKSEKKKIESELEFVAEKDTDKSKSYRAKFPNMGDEQDDNAAEVYTYEQNLAIEQDLEIVIKKINQALKNIKNGTYGRCEKGDLIEPARLKVIPWASTCIKHSK